MSTRITLCRDIENPASAECSKDHEAADAPMLSPCSVKRSKCAQLDVDESPGPEAESSATNHDEMGIEDCCDC